MDLHRNTAFVRLFLGRVVTNVGDSLYTIAAMWLVYALTGSTFYTGVAGFLTRVPAALQFLAGPLVDRWRLRRVLVGTQLAQGVLVLVVPVAAYLGALSVWVVLSIVPVMAAIAQLGYPAHTAAVPRLVDDERLVSANSAMSFAMQSVNLGANAAGGLLVATLGAVTLYTVDAATFAVAAVLFATITFAVTATDRSEPTAAGAATTDGGEPAQEAADEETGALDGYLDELREGIRYIRGSLLAALVAGALVVNFVFGISTAVLPAYADGLGGAETYGLLLAAISGGNLLGSAAVSLIQRYPFGRVLAGAGLLSALTWAGALLVGWLPATVALFVATFVPIGATNVAISAAIQSAVDEDLLGRVSSVLSSASTAALPIASLVGGVMGSVLGPVTTLWVSGGGFLVLAGYILARPALRELPPVAELDAESLRLGEAA
ncbi:MAG: MFS transporter [Halobacteriaceae archaeon]